MKKKYDIEKDPFYGIVDTLCEFMIHEIDLLRINEISQAIANMKGMIKTLKLMREKDDAQREKLNNE